MIIHVDMSGKYAQKKTVGLAAVGLNTTGKEIWHKGIVLKKDFLEGLRTQLIKPNYGTIHGILITILLKNAPKYTEVIICNDEKYVDIKKGLAKNIHEKAISISEYRMRFGKKLRSQADGLANSIRKRAGRNIPREKGRELSIQEVNLKEIVKKYKEKAGSGLPNQITC